MKLAVGKQKAARLIDDMKELVDTLPQNTRTELIAALKQIFSELDPAADGEAAAPRSA